MHWANIVPELILLTLIVAFQQAEPSFIVYLIYGLLYGVFLACLIHDGAFAGYPASALLLGA
jgi:hypothetical protein